MCKVSIVIPVWNADKYLDKLFHSLLEQTYTNYEVICVNDGSTDCSEEILKSYAQKDERIRIFTIPNGGPANARNYGVIQARGEYIQFIDSDDWIERNMLEDFASKSNGADIVVSGAFFEYEKRKNTKKRVIQETGYCNAREEIVNIFRRIKPNERSLFLNYLWNKWFKRSFLLENQIQQNSNFRLGEDFLFVVEAVAVAQSMAVLPGAYYHYMLRGESSLVNHFDINEQKRREAMYAASRQLYETLGILNEKQNELETIEGEYCWFSLLKINFKDCTLKKEEKIGYIRGFLSGRQRRCLLKYLCQKLSITKMMAMVAVCFKCPSMLYGLIDKE